MKRLFSPWRSQYIATFKNESTSKRCLFCSMANARTDEKNLIISRRKHCFAVMNLYPYNSGHLMVVPYRHTDTMSGLEPDESAEVMGVAAEMMELLKKVVKPAGFNFGANLGRVGGAGIDKHVHFHIVPRWNGDTNFMPVLGDVKVISEDMRATYKKLRAVLPKR